MPLRCASLRRAKPLLGTLVEIGASGDPGHLVGAMNAAFAAVRRIHAAMSFHDAASDVSRLNRSALHTAVRVDAQTWTVLARARQIAAASDGDFDVTVAPRLVRSGFLPDLRPDPGRRRLPDCGYQAIELLDGNRVRLHEPRWIDLGGIAKGYAADCAGAVLRDHGIDEFVVNAGGDLAIGRVAAPVHVRHPDRPDQRLPLGQFCGGVATSAQYYALREGGDAGDAGDGVRGGGRHPIINPATGAAADYAGSLTVAAPDAMTADALTKVIAIRGEASRGILRIFHAQAFVVAAPLREAV